MEEQIDGQIEKTEVPEETENRTNIVYWTEPKQPVNHTVIGGDTIYREMEKLQEIKDKISVTQIDDEVMTWLDGILYAQDLTPTEVAYCRWRRIQKLTGGKTSKIVKFGDVEMVEEEDIKIKMPTGVVGWGVRPPHPVITGCAYKINARWLDDVSMLLTPKNKIKITWQQFIKHIILPYIADVKVKNNRGGYDYGLYAYRIFKPTKHNKRALIHLLNVKFDWLEFRSYREMVYIRLRKSPKTKF